jgi:hypothetical protein
MDQANFWQAWEVSATAPFNQQLGNDPESMSLALGDLHSVQAAFPGSVTSPGASLIPVPSLPIQSPGASLIPYPANCVGFSGFAPLIASLPIQSPDASLIPSLANYAGFSGFAPPIPSLPQSPIASSIPSLANYAALSEDAPAASIGYRSQTNKPSLLQHQSYYDDIPKDFPNYPLFNHAILPLDSNTAHQFGLRPYDGSNNVLSGFQQIPGPVNSNSRLNQLCLRCRGLKQKVFLFS